MLAPLGAGMMGEAEVLNWFDDLLRRMAVKK
jgi:hypothetical protein